MRKKIYISGPITKGDRKHNFEQAEDAFLVLGQLGFAPLNPMLTMKLAFAFDGTFSHREWLDMDIPWVMSADALLRLPGDSDGADEEVIVARNHSVPVFFSEKTRIVPSDLLYYFSEIEV